MNELLTTQSAYSPRVEGETVSAPVIVCGGMGGSSFPVRIARFLSATSYLITHQDYGLPKRVPEGAHYVALSYSGETEETLSFAQEAIKNGLPVSVITTGGALLALAKEHQLSYVEVPKLTVPRESVVAMTKAFLALIGQQELLVTNDFTFDVEVAEKKGQELQARIYTQRDVKVDLGVVQYTKEEYEKRSKSIGKIDFSKLSQYEVADNTTGAKEFACVAGVCEV